MRIVIIGGGPAGYEAALVAAELGAEVVLVSDEGLGGNTVLWDCVPSKALIAASLEAAGRGSDMSSPRAPGTCASRTDVDFPGVLRRIHALAQQQSQDIHEQVRRVGVRFVGGRAELAGAHTVVVRDREGTQTDRIRADAVLIATGSVPRTMPSAPIDGEVVLSSRDLYRLPRVPERLVVVGSGATGAEYANAFLQFGADVTFVISRDRLLPSQDRDAALVLEEVFDERGMQKVRNARAERVERVGGGAVVHLDDGQKLEGSHVLLAIGQVPRTDGLGLHRVGVRLDQRGAVRVDGVSRTGVPGIYAAGDVTATIMLASVAAMQGRIAMWHLLGQAVAPLRLDAVAATVFTDPQIATVGVSEQQAQAAGLPFEVESLPLTRNSRGKMAGLRHGFVKLIVQPGSGTVIGGSVVAGYASDLIAPISVAVHNRLTAAQLSQAFQIYPSLTGSVQEVARRLAARVQSAPVG